jgi:D-3-phosphoglycerate dehydrogenase / 2-oxoglutarate reductase
MSISPEKDAIKVLFIDSTHLVLPERLKSAGLQVVYQPEITKTEVEEIIHLYDGVVVRSKLKLDSNLLEKATKLKFIARVGSGLENIDVACAGQRNIICLNAPEGNRDAVGEHTLGILLAMMNKISRADAEVKTGKWIREANRGFELKGKTIGIIGYGNMGSAFAQRLKGFEVTTLAYDKYKFDYSDDYVEENTLEEIFEKTDILSLHVPLTNETSYLVNKEFLSKFHKNIFLVNTSRGKVVNTDDLVWGLKNRKVLGAALDVLEYEKSNFEELHQGKIPEEYDYLLNHPTVLITPHIAGWTFESEVKLAEVLSEKIIHIFGKII